MNEKEKLLASFDKNVQWLRNNIPPDDIYEFTEQALMGTDFFFYKWHEYVDIEYECENDDITKTWVTNLVGLRMLMEEGKRVNIKTEFKYLENEKSY